jgi:hypothetical protein
LPEKRAVGFVNERNGDVSTAIWSLSQPVQKRPVLGTHFFGALSFRHEERPHPQKDTRGQLPNRGAAAGAEVRI